MRFSKPSIAVILPAYNEELTIGQVIRDFHAALPDAVICVVDNNSSDRTSVVAAATFEDLGCAGRLIHEKRQGKGNALRRAFFDVDADIYLMADADQTYPASRAADMIAPVARGEADMVVGDRHSGGHYGDHNKRRFHGFGNDLVKSMINFFFRSSLQDIMSGYRAFSRTFVKTYPIMVAGFQVETDMTLHALDKRFRVMEIPVEYVDRPAGSFSKLNTLADGAKVIFAIFQILRYYKPLAFFGTVSVVLMMSGFVAGIPVLADWFTYQYIYHVPLAVLAAALEIVAVIFFSVALMLDSIVHQHKMSYELMIVSIANKT
ncbi:glycosyltransferase [Polaromonas sp.]|uniref:glycosyltransferase n=1 Tax=Polaromonas sp. TaxID=1869339 RepID=UPI003265B202